MIAMLAQGNGHFKQSGGRSSDDKVFLFARPPTMIQPNR